MAEKVIAKEGQLGIPIGEKIVLGQLTTFTDGSSKWTYRPDISGLGDQSTFTSSKSADGKWGWSPTTSTSLTNLANREGITEEEVKKSLYSTTQTQTVLNAGRVTQLGTNEARKLGLPGATGTATVTGQLPSQISNGSDVSQEEQQGGKDTQEATTEKVLTGTNNFNNLKIDDSSETRTVNEYPDNKNLKYPITLKAEDQDCITFTMLEYRPRKLSPTGIAQGSAVERNRSTPTTKQRGRTVTLPIQPSISDSNTVNWGPDELSATAAIAAATAFSTIKDNSAGAAASIESIRKLIGTDKSGIGAGLAAYYAGEAAGVKGLLTRVTGAIINPNMELLFNGPQLRNFNFVFTLSARNDRESKVIRNIIRFFKQGMSTKRAKTGLFLKTPHTFEIKYLHKGTEHKWINKIKECALTGCNVNYTPAGNYATYNDGSMTSYEITLSFGELEPIYDDDYGKGSTSFDSEIGY